MDSERFDTLVKDVKVIIKSAKGLGIELAGGGGDKGTKPIAKKDLICFNGVEEEAHETLFIERESSEETKKGLVFNFCKTARKPYDTIVSAVLVALKKHFPESEISSDGDMKTFLNGSMGGQKGDIPLCVELFGEDYVKDFKMSD